MTACKQYGVISEMEGGASHLLSLLLSNCFFNELGNHMERSGMVLKMHGDERATVAFCAVMGILLADVLALQEMILWKGHQGFKICPRCSNCGLRKWMEPRPDGVPGVLYPHTHLEKADFVQHTDETVRASIERLAELKAMEVTSERYIEAETIHGFTYSEKSVLAQRGMFNVITILMFDWMHVYLVGGLLDEEFGMCMSALKKAHSTWTYEKVGQWLAEWRTPQRVQKFTKLFDETAAKSNYKSNSFSCSASDMLSLTPLLSHLVGTVMILEGI